MCEVSRLLCSDIVLQTTHATDLFTVGTNMAEHKIMYRNIRDCDMRMPTLYHPTKLMNDCDTYKNVYN